MNENLISDDPAAQYGQDFIRRWDRLIDWDRRRKSEGNFFVDQLRLAPGSRVLDVATGTGFHSILLALSGFEVTSTDGNAHMLEQACANASRFGVKLKPIAADWRKLHGTTGDNFDALLCLGSSFPHLVTEVDQHQALREFHTVLRPGGLCIVDHRNFDALLAGKYKTSGRYYYCGRDVQVSVAMGADGFVRLTYDFADGESFTLRQRPIRLDDMRRKLRDAGFDSITTFGDFEARFDAATAEFLIHVAKKGP